MRGAGRFCYPDEKTVMADNNEQLALRIRSALQTVKTAGGEDVVLSGHVQNIEAGSDGVVKFQFLLQPEDPGTLVREARAAAEGVDGVTKVKIDVRLPNAPSQQPKRGLQPGSVPAPTPDANLVAGIDHVIAVSSGKGGVGKSTVAVNLAAALAAAGKRVGLLDADVYGPDIPLMFGEKRKPRVTGDKGSEKIVPLEAHGVKLMSLGFLLEDEQPAIMRGPLISGILKQFLEQVEWGELDYLFVDMPPGTGDAQLSLVQIVNLDGAVLVTTPQDVSTGDVRRAVRMFERVNTRIFGIVENMAGMSCPHCSGHIDVFGHGGGAQLAEDMHLPLLGSVPLDPQVREAGDIGTPTTIAAPDSPAGAGFRQIADRIVEAVEGVAA
jgi:ATP-binding protein involved in chromosome partitioning